MYLGYSGTFCRCILTCVVAFACHLDVRSRRIFTNFVQPSSSRILIFFKINIWERYSFFFFSLCLQSETSTGTVCKKKKIKYFFKIFKTFDTLFSSIPAGTNLLDELSLHDLQHYFLKSFDQHL